MIRRRAALAALPFLVLIGLVAACAPDPGAPSPTTSSTTTASTTTSSTVPKHVMSIGHADAFEITVSGSTLVAQIKDDSGSSPVFRDPAQTILHVKPESQITLPDPPGAFSFLGAGGSPVWLLPQVQNSNLLWPGASTERIGSGVLQGNSVNWTIQSVTGPGGLHVFQNGAFGTPQIWFTTGAALPQTKPLAVPAHVHFNWAFGATGTYTVVMRADATLVAGTPVTTGPVTYTFQVGAL